MVSDAPTPKIPTRQEIASDWGAATCEYMSLADPGDTMHSRQIGVSPLPIVGPLQTPGLKIKSFTPQYPHMPSETPDVSHRFMPRQDLLDVLGGGHPLKFGLNVSAHHRHPLAAGVEPE